MHTYYVISWDYMWQAVASTEVNDMTKLVVFMEMGAINSGKGRVFLEIDYTLKSWQTCNSQHTLFRMENDPRVKEYKSQGYAGPRLISSFKENLRDELLEVQADVDRGNWIESHQQKLEKKLIELKTVEKLYDAGKVEL